MQEQADGMAPELKDDGRAVRGARPDEFRDEKLRMKNIKDSPQSERKDTVLTFAYLFCAKSL